MRSVTAEAPRGDISKSQAIRYKKNNRKDIKLSNKMVLFYGSVIALCDDVTCNYIKILAELPVSTSHIATVRRFCTSVQGHLLTYIKELKF